MNTDVVVPAAPRKGNVLVLGNSGVGKSTLINAVIGQSVAKTSFGTHGTTSSLSLYDSPHIPFRIIDSIGFEPNLKSNIQAVYAVRKWSRNSAKHDDENSAINVIWFCIDGTSSKLFADSIRNFARASALWRSVPVIVVITKSYSKPDRDLNIAMVREAFKGVKRADNIRAIIPVVAQNYVIDETTIIGPENIDTLINHTNALMPEGIQAGSHDISTFTERRQRALAQSLVAGCVTAGATVGAVPIPFADTLILSPLELGMLNGLAKIYGIEEGQEAKQFFGSIVTAGSASAAAQSALSALKAIQGLNIATSVLNAAVAASFIAAIGETSIMAFEQVRSGEHSVRDTQWVTKLMEASLGQQFIHNATQVIEQSAQHNNPKDMRQMIVELAKAAVFSSKRTGK